MFQQSTVKAFSIVAMVLSAIGLTLGLVLAFRITGNFIIALLSITSWVILLWASYIGYRLSTYKLYEDEYKKVGIRIYLIIVAFLLFFFIGVTIGLILSVVLLGALWALKSNYDDWDNSDTPPVPEDTPPNP
jgi:hypothetical protein